MPTIYRIRHVATDRCYIGRTNKDEPSRRFAEHRYLLRRGKHPSPRMQNAWDKYGEEAFVFETVAVCDSSVAVEIEQKYLLSVMCVFNARKLATQPNAAPPDRIEELRKRMTGNQYTKGRKVTDPDEIESRAKHHRGRKRPPETGQRISAFLKGNQNAKGRVVSEETRLKIKLATDATRPTMTGKKHSPETIEKIRLSNIATKARKKAEREAGAP